MKYLHLAIITTLTTFGCGSYPAGEIALAALESSDETTVSMEKKWISFEPTESVSDIGFVFYPGGKVKAEAYAPIIRNLADAGISSYILYLPQDLAILNGDAAEKVMDNIAMDGWVVSGHSLGGVTAAKMASEDERIVGLSLWASYPGGSVDLSDSDLPTQSFAGSEDTVLNWENWDASIKQLPDNTDWITVEGGNHAQFGDYGPQEGDGDATISAEVQWNITTEKILELFENLDTTLAASNQ